MCCSKGKILFFLALNLSFVAHADEFILKPSIVASINIEASFANAGQTQTLDLTPQVTKTYTANNLLNVLPAGELFVGLKNGLPANLEGQLGLAFAVSGRTTLSGNIWDDADPAFDNYTYQYSVSHLALSLKAKIAGDWDFPIKPWVGATVGVGFNMSSGFTNTPTIPQVLPSANFADNTVTALSYSLSTGAAYKLDSQWELGVGYEFSDWGSSQLGAVPGGTNLGPSLSHLFTHSVLFSVTYVLGLL